jgi:hypothetical protein
MLHHPLLRPRHTSSHSEHRRYRNMSRETPSELFDSEEACRAKAASLRTTAEGDPSSESQARTLEIAAEWEAKADRACRPIARRLKPRIFLPLFFTRLLRR